MAALPLSEAKTLPACAYADPAFHAFERQHVFAASWQLLARAGQLDKTGDHVVAECAGRPVILVRGNDGMLRGFFNVCKHRAGPLALTDGNARQLQCKYHGWSYTLEGQLRAVHEMQEAKDFDIACIHLDPISTGVWQGLIFAAVQQPPVPLENLLAGITERFAPIELGQMEFHSQVAYDLECNWKVYVDNYLEGYHLPHVHPGLNRLLDYRSYSTHTAEWYSWQHSPLDGSPGPYAAGEAHYYFVFPNLMLNILPGRLQINRVLPVSQRQCRVLFDYYYADIESAAVRKMIEEDLRFSDEVQKEDIGICERVQQGLESGSYTAGRLSPRREAGVHHFQELVRRRYRQVVSGK
ncbi:MAG: aromatic ring-hydroxylating dioxygenase subunit alpha [Gammaproteobacteria bacterium]|nr:aromatic ring-hydroxylating dioxygenase subunit alpha [Gammaproteobacteria bacterium]MDE2345666.1 aromatic ring-hydroxylating dioxygenase subunit alpha [Gammaproteobacteria bacterium]